MTEVYPISCISCRRKKIKCNKQKPCNQCKKRQIICQFPSTFRNIEINEDNFNELDNNIGSFEVGDLVRSIKHLKQEKRDILAVNNQLSEHNKKLLNSLRKLDIQSNYFDFKKSDYEIKDLQDIDLQDHNMTDSTSLLEKDELADASLESNLQESPMSKDKFKISGETTELGDKYYGPQSSSFMMELLKNNQQSHRRNGSSENFNFMDNDNDIKWKRSLIKKPLPTLKSDASFDENLSLIFKLVERFFHNYSCNYYKTFISKINVLDFLNNYTAFDNQNWENDDYLLLIYMILIFAIERSTPSECVDLFNITISEYSNFSYNLVHNNLFFNFEKLRHNSINESIVTIQSYILCTEFYFIEQKYEECWSMMFHTCSIAYSIGLHVTNKLKLTKFNEIDLNVNSDLSIDGSEDKKSVKRSMSRSTVSNSSDPPTLDSTEDGTAEEDPENSDESNANNELDDINKLKVWFTLRILSDKVCSILGRPNPISIQINSTILKTNQNYSNINLNQNSTSILLKIGLSECLRLSNMMLIENFMIDFTINDLLNLNSKFEKEIYLLELYLEELDNSDTTSKASTRGSAQNLSSSSGNEQSSSSGTNRLDIKSATVNLPDAPDPSTSASSNVLSEKGHVSTSPSHSQSNSSRAKSRSKSSGASSGSFSSGSDYSRNEISYDEFNYLPIKIEKMDLLNDLIVFYINKAKLFEPFIIKFNKNENDSILILKNLSNSIINFLKLIDSIMGLFEIKLSKKRLNYLKVGKYFRLNFPFLSSFVYQGVIIIFTLLNYKSKDFIALKYNDTFDNLGFLKELKHNLVKLIGIDSNFTEKIWSINTVYLINKNISIIEGIENQIKAQEFRFDEFMGDIRDPQAQVAQAQTQQSQVQHHHSVPVAHPIPHVPPPPTQHMPQMPQRVSSISMQNPLDQDFMAQQLGQASEFMGFNLNDPFWITNPDNLPYYLSSPNEEMRRQTEEEMKHHVNNASQGSSGPMAPPMVMGSNLQPGYYQQQGQQSQQQQPQEQQQQQNDTSEEKANKKIKLDDFLPNMYSRK